MRVCLDLPSGFQLLGDWLFNWQTLTGGLLALFAAIWAGSRVNNQIRQTEKHHQAELQRRHNAVRAIMPLALSSINSWRQFIVNRCHLMSNEPDELMGLDNHQRNFEFTGGEGILTHGFFKVEAIPNDIMNTLKDFVETLSCQVIIKNTAEMVSNIQDLTSDLAARRYQDRESYYSGLDAFSTQADKIEDLHNIIDAYCRNFDVQIIDAGHKN